MSFIFRLVSAFIFITFPLWIGILMIAIVSIENKFKK